MRKTIKVQVYDKEYLSTQIELLKREKYCFARKDGNLTVSRIDDVSSLTEEREFDLDSPNGYLELREFVGEDPLYVKNSMVDSYLEYVRKSQMDIDIILPAIECVNISRAFRWVYSPDFAKSIIEDYDNLEFEKQRELVSMLNKDFITLDEINTTFELEPELFTISAMFCEKQGVYDAALAQKIIPTGVLCKTKSIYCILDNYDMLDKIMLAPYAKDYSGLLEIINYAVVPEGQSNEKYDLLYDKGIVPISESVYEALIKNDIKTNEI